MDTILRALIACASCFWLLSDTALAADRARPNVLLITIDTLRADRVGAYGYPVDTTPAIDAFAKEAVRFGDVTVQWPQTWPSMASMMTGKYPARTGVRFSPRRALAPGHVTLAEVLSAAGYRTAAVIANATIGKKAGFDQGFDVFVESWLDEVIRRTGTRAFKNEAGKVKQFTDARIVTDKALEILATVDGKQPFFLWLHYIDPHGPYDPPKEYADVLERVHPLEHIDPRLLPEYQKQPSPTGDGIIADLGFYKAQYDRGIRYVDDQLSRVLAAVARAPWGDKTLEIVTADHGESLGEHRYYLEHGAVPYQPSARVPLLIAFDGHLPAGTVVEPPVGLIDLLPTLLELVDVSPLPGLDGKSLVSLMRGAGGRAPQHVFMESGHRRPSQVAVRRGRWKLVRTRSRADRHWLGLPEVALFNLEVDPGERTNLVERYPEVTAELRAALDAWLEASAESQPVQATEIEEVEPATKEMIRILGYGG